MSKESFQWVILLLLVIGLIGVGTVVAQQRDQLSRLGASMDALARSPSLPEVRPAASAGQPIPAPRIPTQDAPAGSVTITQKTVTWNGTVGWVAHLCQGSIRAGYRFGGEGQAISYCIGENQLAFIDGSGKVSILETRTVSAAEQAPVLLGVDLVPGSRKGTVLIGYAAEPCTTTNDCGVGMPTNHVRFAYDLADQRLRAVAHYPEYGQPAWNPSGTKAVFIRETCGGAGCLAEPLIGYDLATDAMKTVTTVTAARTESGRAQDTEGNRLPTWGSVTWENETRFSVTRFSAEGVLGRVPGTF